MPENSTQGIISPWVLEGAGSLHTDAFEWVSEGNSLLMLAEVRLVVRTGLSLLPINHLDL